MIKTPTLNLFVFVAETIIQVDNDMFQKEINILLIDINQQDAGFCEKILAQSKLMKCKVIWTDGFEMGREQLFQEQFDIVFLDISGIKTDSFNLFYTIHELAPETPIVVLTDKKNEKLACKTVREGALKYIKKNDLNLDTLEYTICSTIERKAFLSEIQQSPNIDRLTGVYNSQGFMILAEQMLRFTDRTWSELVVLYADLDNLTEINASYGSKEGYRLLCDTAKIFLKTFREADLIARMGSDAFICMAVETEKTELIIKRLDDSIAEFNKKSKRPYSLSISFGGEKYKSESPISLEELIKSARDSMLDKKRDKI